MDVQMVEIQLHMVPNAKGLPDDQLVRQIYKFFVEAIKRGDFGPGARIPAERTLAAQFSASRTTVRKALSTLEEDRLIERKLGSGTYVRQPSMNADRSASEVPAVSPLDVLEARLAIEPGISELAVARATAEDFDRIARTIDVMEKIALEGEDREFKEAGYRVQLEIARATRNPLLIRIYELLVAARGQAGWDTLRKLTESPDDRMEMIKNARKQLEAMRARDAEGSREGRRDLNKRLIHQIVGMTANGVQE